MNETNCLGATLCVGLVTTALRSPKREVTFEIRWACGLVMASIVRSEDSVTTTGPSGKRVGRKSYKQLDWLCVFLAQKYYRNGARPLREVATLLAKAKYAPRSGIYGPAAIRKMVMTQLTPSEVRRCELYWEKEGRSELAERVLPAESHRKSHWIIVQKRNKRRECFQWLKE
jgi:hypothetical protein